MAKSKQWSHLVPKGSQFFDGKLVSGDGNAHEIIYPATSEALGTIHWAHDNEIAQAIDAAQKGYEIWRNTPLAERADILRETARLLREQNREIAELETLDTGKALQETLVVDIISGAQCLEYFAAQAAFQSGEQVSFSGEAGNGCLFANQERLCGDGAW